jgi:hypothetical protein
LEIRERRVSEQIAENGTERVKRTGGNGDQTASIGPGREGGFRIPPVWISWQPRASLVPILQHVIYPLSRHFNPFSIPVDIFEKPGV